MSFASNAVIPVHHYNWYSPIEMPSGNSLYGAAAMNYRVRQCGGMAVLLNMVSEHSFYYGYSNGISLGHYQGFGNGYFNGVLIGYNQGFYEGYQMALNQINFMMNSSYTLRMSADYGHWYL